MLHTIDGMLAEFPGRLFNYAFGDWCPPNEGTWESFHGDPEVTDCALLGYFLQIMEECAEILEKTEDVARWKAERVRFAQVFREKLFHPEAHSYGGGSQATSVLPLAFGLVPAKESQAVFATLLKRIEADGGKIGTGIFGTRYIGEVPCDGGQADLAVHLMTQPEYPGFGFMFANGATTLWEQWSFRGPMNSHNHAMFAGGSNFLWSRIGGIAPAAPGWSEIAFRPVFPSTLQFAEVSCKTARGFVRSAWRRTNDGIELKLSVPVGATATAELPGAILENGTLLAPSKPPRADGRAHYTLVSGDYTLLAK